MADKRHGKTSFPTPNRMMLRRTLFLLIVCGIVAFIVLAAKLFQIQILQHEKYESLAVEQQVRETVVKANRGTIYDRNMKILAMSASADTIYISPAEIKMYDEDPELIALKLAEILDLNYEDILEKTKKTSSWYVTIATKVEQEVSDKVREFKNEYNLKGVKIEPDTKRYYPYSSLASHVIGFVGVDNYGLAGIEATYDKYLSGVSGRIVRAKNSAGTDMLFTKFEDYYDAQDGNDVVLTIDSTIQYYLEKHLQQAVLDYDVQNGAAGIVMNVKTGEILGMCSLGNFDLNNYQDVSYEVKAILAQTEDKEERIRILRDAQNLQWRNKAISDTYEPGSTFKIITMAMALEEGIVNINDHFYCGGSIPVLGRNDPVNCWRSGGHGSQTLTQAMQHSCNVALVNIGLRVGARTFYKYAEAFGFFDRANSPDVTPTGKTGIDLGGESGSLWWSQNVFYNEQNLSQLAAASFGQTFNITPVQLITAVSAVCNGGYLMKPYVVKEVVDSDGNIVMKNEPTVVRQVISKETSKTMCEILEKVVGDRNEGTGRNAYVAGYRIAGKTGTSQKVAQEAAENIKEYIVSFIGIVPADDPQVAVLMLLDTPSNETGIYISGGQMAAPTVGKIFADVLPYLGIEAVYTEEELTHIDKTVPNLKGLTLEEARAVLKNMNLDMRVIGSGAVVTDQLPHANAVVATQSQIIVYTEGDASEGEEAVPDLTGLTYSVARQRMGYYGLFIKNSSGIIADSETVLVAKQSVEPGTMVKHGTVIEVTLVDNSNLGRY
ncbi:MAG: penicillin-binding transpeptidase domain-containing protein [Oscillospiraceae bacterium]|jgi:stage V sporulation protein D (sporulation-specific penicillin-binding protein)